MGIDVVKNVGMKDLPIFKADKFFFSIRNVPIYHTKVFMSL